MGKGLLCTFHDNVVCPHKKCEHQRFLSKCEKCLHYRVFMREMEEEEDAFFAEVKRIRRTGKWE